MSLYPPPTANVPVFNPALFTDVNGGVSYGSVGVGSFVNYPTAQGAVTWTNGTSTATLDNGSVTLSVINGTTLQGVGLNGDGIAYNDGTTIQGATWENLVTKVKAIGAITATSDPAVPPTQPKILNVNDTIQIQNGETATLPHTFVSLSADANLLRMNLCQDGVTDAYGTAGQVLKSGGSAGSMYWGTGGGGSVGTLQDVLTNGNTATLGMTLTDSGFTSSKIKLQNESGAYSELASGGMYCQNIDATDNFQLTAQALLFKGSAIGISATNASTLDISTPTLTFSQLGGDPTNVLTLDGDYNAVWSPSATVGLQDVFNTNASATVVGDTPSSPDYNPLGMTINTDTGPLYIGSNIKILGGDGDTRTMPSFFSGSYFTDGGNNIGKGQYGLYRESWALNATDNDTGVIDKSFTCSFKGGFQYSQPTTDVQATQLKLNLTLTDANGNVTTYDQNSATINSNNLDNTGGNGITLDATQPLIQITNNDGIGNALVSSSTPHSLAFNFTDITPTTYEKFRVDSGTTLTDKTELIMKTGFATDFPPYNAYSAVDIYTAPNAEYIGRNPTGITVFTSTLNVANQSEVKVIVETDDGFHLENSAIVSPSVAEGRDNPLGGVSYSLFQNRLNNTAGGVVNIESSVSEKGFGTFTADARDPTNPNVTFNTFKIETDKTTQQTFLGASDQLGNYFQFTNNKKFELTSPNDTGNKSVFLDTSEDEPSIILSGPTSTWKMTNAGIDSGTFTPQVFNFGLSTNDGYTWTDSTAGDVGRTLYIEGTQGFVVLSPYRTQTNNTGSLPSDLSSVTIIFPAIFGTVPTFTFNSFASDGSLTTECVLTSLTTHQATISYTGGVTDNISWTAIGKVEL